MRVGRSFLAVVALSCGGVVVPHTAAADEWNKQTVLTFSQDVEIPGTDRSSTEPDAAFKVLEPPVGAKRIETRPQEDAGIESLCEALLEPGHRLILVVERRIDHGNLRGIRIGGTRVLLQIAQKLDRFVFPA